MRLASEDLDREGEGSFGATVLGERQEGRVRERYDHTDMEDVNGLIEEYRRMSLGGCM